MVALLSPAFPSWTMFLLLLAQSLGMEEMGLVTSLPEQKGAQEFASSKHSGM